MKFITSSLLLIYVLFISSCSKNSFYEATVLGSTGCSDISIKFDEPVNTLDPSLEHIYMCKDLPKEYQIEGKRISVKVRNPQANERFLCTTYYLNYSQVVILGIKDL